MQQPERVCAVNGTSRQSGYALLARGPDDAIPSVSPAEIVLIVKIPPEGRSQPSPCRFRIVDYNQQPDYSLDLGRMAKGLAVVYGQLDAINKHPALRMTPELHRQAIAQAGSELMRDAAQKLDRRHRTSSASGSSSPL
jgi:hypothetical protein